MEKQCLFSLVYCDICNKDNHTSHVPNPHRTTHAYCSYCSESSSAINERILQVDGNASMDDDDDFSDESDTISNLSSLSLPQTGDQPFTQKMQDLSFPNLMTWSTSFIIQE